MARSITVLYLYVRGLAALFSQYFLTVTSPGSLALHLASGHFQIRPPVFRSAPSAGTNIDPRDADRGSIYSERTLASLRADLQIETLSGSRTDLVLGVFLTRRPPYWAEAKPRDYLAR